MRRLLLITHLLFLSFYCFAQQNLPGKIIGKIPDKKSAEKYEIQVGAFTLEKNTEQALSQLRNNALNPVTEQYLHFTRVMIKRIPADQVTNFLVVLKQAGFNEVIIRENTITSISEKWEIDTPGSVFASFEFNHDMNYIAIESDEEKPILFGEYTMPNKDTINMDNLGVIKITRNGDDISFIFSPFDEPGKEINLSAVKMEAMYPSPELDLICRTWEVTNCTKPENIGNYLFISNTGTYFFTTPDGVSNNLSRWRWHDDNRKEFEYSHDNWDHYGKAQITSLTQTSLDMLDPGFRNTIPGYSEAGIEDQWELSPVR